MILNNQCLPDYCPSGGVPVSFAYDLAGEMTSYTTGTGVTLSQVFDSAGRVSQLTSSMSDAQHPATLATVDSAVGFYPPGEVRKLTFGNGLTETAAFNNRLQPCRLNVNNSGSALATCNDGVIAGLGDFTYGYNIGTADNGNVVSFSSVGTQNFNRTYTYDSLNRLQAMSAPGDSCTGLSWTYDAWANRTDQTVTGGSCNSFHQPVNAQNWLSSSTYQYDAAGNMIHDGSHSYTYDAENRLIQVDGGSTASYIYDALGRRISKTAGAWTNYVYDASGAVMTEYSSLPSNCAWPCWQASYIHMGGKLTAEYKDGTTYFFNQDHLGSTRFLTKPDQSLADSMDYLPYGEQIAGTSETTHKFTGKERDGETGLDYFGARYYSNGLGRFVTPDPLMASAHVSGPQSWNRYAYVFNNPLRYVDPNGMEVPEGCAKDNKCQITVKVNVIWDKTANNGKGLTDKQKDDFKKNQIDQAVKDYAKSNIKLEVTYTEGSFSVDSNKHVNLSGGQSGSLNVVASTQTIDGNNESFMTKSGAAITLINVNDKHDNNAFPLFTNSSEHEIAHQFLGDTAKPPSSAAGYIANEFNVDARVQGQHMGISQQGFREGLEPRSYANPTNPEANKPQQH